MKKKNMVLILLLALSLLATACGGATSTASTSAASKTASTEKAKDSADKATSTTGKATNATTDVAKAKAGMKRVDILQFAQHGSLDNCRDGFIKGLADAGFKEGVNISLRTLNADADMATTNQIAANFVAEKSDLICAIATPAAQAAYNAALKSNTPVIFSAVSDPVAAELAKADKTPAGAVTGTSDILPVESQLKMIRELLPAAKKLGILYTTSETNSISTIEIYKSLAPKYGFELITGGVAQSADIPLATDNILSKVDCLSNLTDNTVVSSLPLILEKAAAKKIPIFGSEVEQVKIGCLAASGIDYFALGEITGQMAAKVLKGEAKASELKFETIKEPYLYLNLKVAKDLSIELPKSALDRAKERFEGK